MEGSRPGVEAEDQPLPLAGFVHREVSPLFGSGGSFPVLLVVTLFFLHHFCSLLVRDPQVVCPWLALVGPRSLNSFPSVALSSVFFHLESLCSPHLLLSSASRVAERNTLEFITGFSLHSMPRNVTGSSSSSPGWRVEGAQGCHRHSRAPGRWLSRSGSLKQTQAVY